jgi:natural product biosynthesis luciferase-like monooxygenase protein
VAATLQRLGAPGERAILLYPPGIEYIAAFFGCMYAGVLAVPAYPPDPSRLQRSLPRLVNICSDSGAKFLLTTSAIAAMGPAISEMAPVLRDMSWVASDEIKQDAAARWSMPSLSANDLAFLQYTSGSTGNPRGVMLSHENLLHNIALIRDAAEMEENSTGISWLPPYHDMGLIGSILCPLVHGGPLVFMSPLAFLGKPLRWLAAISKYRGVISGAPNFAYDLCVRRTTPEDVRALDLSSWRVALSGAEPIRQGTLEQFTRHFAPAGFRSQAFYPCYGLAEATLIVTGGAAGAGASVFMADTEALRQNRAIRATDPTQATPLISCGRSVGGQSVVVVDTSNLLPVPTGSIGEVWVAGPSVARGYWARSEESLHTFRAYLADGTGPFLRTGDLGFMRDGEVSITGRLKDLIIIRGANYYPQDFERTVEAAHPRLRKGCAVAFSFNDGGEERLVVVAEVERRSADRARGTLDAASAVIDVPPLDFVIAEVVAAIREAIAGQHQLQVYSVVLIPPGTLPKTSSGKVQRQGTRAEYVAGTLTELARDITKVAANKSTIRPNNVSELIRYAQRDKGIALVEMVLVGDVARILKLSRGQIGPTRPINSFGLDSLLSVELAHKVERSLGVVVPVTHFLRDGTLRELAAQLYDHIIEDMAPPSARPRAFPGRQNILSKGQSALWLMHGLRTGAAYNLVSAFRVRSPVDVESLRQSYQYLYDRHETLRTVFTLDGTGAPNASSRPGGGVGFKVVDSSTWTEAQLRAAVDETAHAPFDLENGPIMRVHLYSRAESDHTLVIAMHHIAADLWSLVVLMGEWAAAYAALRQRQAPALPAPESSYSTFVQWQSDILAGPEADRSWNFWRLRFSRGVPVLELPTDRPRPPVQTFRGASARVAINADLSARIRAFAKGLSVTAYSVLLAGFQTLLARYSGQTEFVVGTPVSGRTRAGFDKTVGYFVNVLPLLTAVDKTATGKSLALLAQAGALDALEHQDYPFVDLVERLAPRRDPSRSPMFDTMFIFERPHLGPERGVSCLMLDPAAPPTEWAGMQLEGYPIDDSAAQFDLVLVVVDTDQGFSAQLKYNTDLFDARTGEAMARHLVGLLDALVSRPEDSVWALDFLSAEEKGELASQPPAAAIPSSSVHGLVQAQAARTPDATAVVFGDEQLTYRQLEERASELASRLATAGAREGALVAICLERSIGMLVAMLAVLKSGAAYVPVDPDYPLDRQLFVLADARPRVLVTSRGQRDRLADPSRQIVCVEDVVPRVPGARPPPPVRPGSLAYVIYTSGSTGKPKGVMIPHRTVVNFFASMDEVIGTGGGTWLAITSISFDISVLELLWTLTRGMKVIIQRADVVAALPRKTLDMGIMFWGQDDAAVARDRYQFFLDAVARADEAGLSAVWIPERHFHGFGGNYPNPSVLAAAAAARTKRIAIRSGSVVLPLQNPVRVAEEWSVVDNLSNGRVGLAIASGWHKNDFVLSPGTFDDRSKVMLDGIDLVRHLWRGGSTQLPNGKGEPTAVSTLPRPVQKELPIWLTAAGSPQTFATAGKRGYNVLTHLLGQDLPTLAEKIAVYRRARREAGHDDGHVNDGHVTLMLHTFVHEDERRVRDVIRAPFTKYLEQSVDLFTPLYRELGLDPTALSAKDRVTLLEFAFERYSSTSGLFGTPAQCRAMLGRVADVGVDEIACLIEFGIDSKTVLEGLRHLTELQRDDSFPAQVRRHGVTHLQCTPSTARVLVETGSGPALGQLERLLVGGEALPGALAGTLDDEAGDRVTNMYGPTETTIWSSTHRVAKALDAITSIGRPIHNTSMYVLDERLQLVPLGARGELYIGGDGLARGYLNRPDLTAERFVPDPYGKPGSRMYATGDVARRMPDGTFQYVGRNDQQVKVRGFRVELGEIESVIQRQASVKDAAVIVDDDPSGDRRLIAYVVSTIDVPGVAGLREAVAATLPGYMVPSAFVALPALPLTPNGKVDRLALRAMQVAPAAAEIVQPRDVVEQALCLEWADLMGREQVGIDDDFFALGGHSLMATRLRTRVAEHLGVELAVGDLFRATTVRKLADVVRPHPHVLERAALLVEVLSDATEQARSA